MSARGGQKLLITSDNSVYLVTVRLRRVSTHILLRYAPQNIRYTQTLYAIDLEALRESYLNSKKLRL